MTLSKDTIARIEAVLEAKKHGRSAAALAKDLKVATPYVFGFLAILTKLGSPQKSVTISAAQHAEYLKLKAAQDSRTNGLIKARAVRSAQTRRKSPIAVTGSGQIVPASANGATPH